jgi:hypothetical protein
LSRHGLLLAIPPGSEVEYVAWAMVQDYSRGLRHWTNRGAWLSELEDVLRLAFPHASSADVTLTARHLAPFPLKEGHDVP